MSDRGEEMVFLISQPRSGSTLLQHVLASHSEVGTLPEPWLLLPLVYALRGDEPDVLAPYNAHFATLALKDFLSRVPGGEAAYEEGVRKLALHLYRLALAGERRRYFVDKTPRYYLIIPELLRLFPAARFVLLLRNPLAVLASILQANLYGDWRGLATPDRRRDVLDAPRLMAEALALAGERATVVRYETLATEPGTVARDLCESLGLGFEPAMLEYGERVHFTDTTFIDHKSIYRHARPVAAYLDGWQQVFDTSHKVALARDYLRSLGDELVGRLGYDYQGLLDTLDDLHPRRDVVVPMRLFMARAGELGPLQGLELRLRRTLHRRLGGWPRARAARP